MRPAQYAAHVRRMQITHKHDCLCPICVNPHPIDRHFGRVAAHLARQVAAPFAAGMLLGAVVVAATGNLGAALRALVGL